MAGLLVSTVLVSSCKSDDDDDDVVNNSELGPAPTADGKKLQVVKNGSSTTIFEYDNEGRVLSVTSSGTKIVFSYTANEVTATSSSGSSSADVTTYTLTNGRITKKLKKGDKSDYITTYTYDGSCLKTMTYTHSNNSDNSKYEVRTTTTYTWENGNIVREVEDKTTTETTTTEKWESGYNDGNRYVEGKYVKVNTNTRTTKKTTHDYTPSEHSFVLPPAEANADEILKWQGCFGLNSAKLNSKEQITKNTEKLTTSSDDKETKTPERTTSSEKKDFYYTFIGSALSKIIETTTDDNNNVKTSEKEYTWN
jgi:hypothetical protein